MNSVIVFPTSKVNALRSRAAKACPEPDDVPEGWTKSDADPMKLLAVFKALKIKPGFVLRAYRFREGGNGNGIIWATPADALFPEPDDCLKLEDRFLSPPKPPQALDDLMDAIEGDGTPWSYLSASLFLREAAEYGAMWHGCNWSTHTILNADPTVRDRRTRNALTSSKPEEWKWNEPRPECWEPSFEQIGDTISIRFFTLSGLGQEAIYRWTDTFKAGNYTIETKERCRRRGSGRIRVLMLTVAC